jgi:molybdate transport system substrate-binding protein
MRPYDMALLGSDAIDRLIQGEHLLPDSRLDWVESPIAIAVPASTTPQNISTKQPLKEAVLQ